MKKIITLLLAAFCINAAFAQSGISGLVTDAKTGESLRGAHIILLSPRMATVSDDEGRFALDGLTGGQYQIEVRHIGYLSMRESFTLDGRSPIETSISLSPTIYSNDEVVITASRLEENLRDIPATVQVITRRDIESVPHQKIDDVLRYAAGINVISPAGLFSMRPLVSLRGLSGDEQGRTLVLVDGVPINKGDTGGVNWSRLIADDIERIEIFHGPGSSIYGNNAMGGVINIITRKPTTPLEGSARMSYGTFNTLMSSARVGGSLGNGFYYNISGMYNNSDGYNDLPEDKREEPDFSAPRFLDEYAASAKAGWMVNPMLNIEIQYDHFRNKKGEGEKIEAPDGEYRKFDTDFIRGRVTGANASFSYDLYGFYQLEKYFRLDERLRGGNYSRFDVKSDREDQGFGINLSNRITAGNRLVYGAEARFGSVTGGDYYVTSPDSIVNSGKLDSYALFAQNEQKFLDGKLTLTAGLRFDYVKFHDGDYITTDGAWTPVLPELNDHNWNAVSPRISLGYRPNDNTRLYATYSQGFRASILDDLCRSGWMWVGPKIANPELGPETIDNFEIGGNFQPSERIIITPSIYFMKGRDFLYYVATGDSLWGTRPIYRRENITGVTVYGVDLKTSFELTSDLRLLLNYSFNHSEIGKFEKNPELEGKMLTYAPEHQIKPGIIWSSQWVDASLFGIYKSKQYTNDDNSRQIDPFVTFDLRLSRRVGDFVMIFGEVRDLFDNERLDTEFSLSPGRLVNVGLGITF